MTSSSSSFPAPARVSGVLAMFDFDHSLIVENSDLWLGPQLAPDLIPHLREWYAEGQLKQMEERRWTDFMDYSMSVLHREGHRAEHIRAAMSTIPMHEGMIATVKALYEAGIEMYIISDANSVFIDVVLEAYGLQQYFPKQNIYTNPAYYDEEGRLRVDYYHNRRAARILPMNDTEVDRRSLIQHTLTHTCTRCPTNLCKGLLVDEIVAHHKRVHGKDDISIIYLGDGEGDFCPATRLSSSSWVLAKRDFPLAKLLDQQTVKAAVHKWDNGEDAHRLYTQFIQAHTATGTGTATATATPAPTATATATATATSTSSSTSA